MTDSFDGPEPPPAIMPTDSDVQRSYSVEERCSLASLATCILPVTEAEWGHLSSVYNDMFPYCQRSIKQLKEKFQEMTENDMSIDDPACPQYVVTAKQAAREMEEKEAVSNGGTETPVEAAKKSEPTPASDLVGQKPKDDKGLKIDELEKDQAATDSPAPGIEDPATRVDASRVADQKEEGSKKSTTDGVSPEDASPGVEEVELVSIHEENANGQILESKPTAVATPADTADAPQTKKACVTPNDEAKEGSESNPKDDCPVTPLAALPIMDSTRETATKQKASRLSLTTEEKQVLVALVLNVVPACNADWTRVAEEFMSRFPDSKKRDDKALKSIFKELRNTDGDSPEYIRQAKDAYLQIFEKKNNMLSVPFTEPEVRHLVSLVMDIRPVVEDEWKRLNVQYGAKFPGRTLTQLQRKFRGMRDYDASLDSCPEYVRLAKQAHQYMEEKSGSEETGQDTDRRYPLRSTFTAEEEAVLATLALDILPTSDADWERLCADFNLKYPGQQRPSGQLKQKLSKMAEGQVEDTNQDSRQTIETAQQACRILLEKQPENAKDPGTGRTNRKTYTDEMMAHLVTLVADILPVGCADWERVASAFQLKFPDIEHPWTADNLMNKFQKMRATKVSSKATCPSFILEAKAVHRRMKEKSKQKPAKPSASLVPQPERKEETSLQHRVEVPIPRPRSTTKPLKHRIAASFKQEKNLDTPPPFVTGARRPVATAGLWGAVNACSLAAVELHLEQGADPNENIAPFLHPETMVEFAEKVNRIRRGEHKSEDCGNTFVRRIANENAVFTLFHLAVFLNFFHGSSETQQILNLMLDHNADVSVRIQGILCYNPLFYHKNGAPALPIRHGQDMTVVDFLVLLGKVKGDKSPAFVSTLQLLSDAAKKAAKDRLGRLEMRSVAKSAFSTWNKLLLSTAFSDVLFVCPDGTQLPAHKNVLCAASSYFSNYFLGPLGDNHKDGKWTVSSSPVVMKAVLKFVYTGEIDSSCAGDENILDLLKVAREFDLESLLNFCETICIGKLSACNIKKFLRLSYLYRAEKLQHACYDFITENSTKVLTNPDFAALAVEDRSLWEKVQSAIASEARKKRDRDDDSESRKRLRGDYQHKPKKDVASPGEVTLSDESSAGAAGYPSEVQVVKTAQADSNSISSARKSSILVRTTSGADDNSSVGRVDQQDYPQTVGCSREVSDQDEVRCSVCTRHGERQMTASYCARCRIPVCGGCWAYHESEAAQYAYYGGGYGWPHSTPYYYSGPYSRGYYDPRQGSSGHYDPSWGTHHYG